LATLLLAAPTAAQRADQELPRQAQGVGVDEKLGDRLPLGLIFNDSAGKPIRLKDAFATGKPVVLTLNYFTCPMLCNLHLSSLSKGLHRVPLAMGKDYVTVTVSINPNEGPEQAALGEKRYLGEYGRPVTDGKGWHFLTGKPAEIEKLADSVGFRYKWLPDAKEYAHVAVTMICSPDGKICRYLYGLGKNPDSTGYDPETLKLSLIEASDGKVGTTLDRVILFCFHFDSGTGKHVLAAVQVMKLGGLATVLALGALLAWFWRRERLRSVAEAMDAGGAAAENTASAGA
ncbi:MAG TPA: SCO family protein, partial [Planctomycetia bacterium]|nr:SCO family protein [Planctomycetia bacterium]